MPVKEPVEVRLAPFEQPPDHEREKARQQQENDDKHVSHRRCKIAAQLAFGDRGNVSTSVHCFASCTVSGNVMLRNTSSRRPSSVCSSRIFQPSCAQTCATLPAKSRPAPSDFGNARTTQPTASSLTTTTLRACGSGD